MRNVYNGMLHRCYDQRSISFPHYGAKGVSVCARWRASFADFLNDVGLIPRGMSLDRIDSKGAYEPENIRLATPTQQNNNKADTTSITFRGKTQTVTAWSIETGMSKQAIFYRLKAGWPTALALGEPLNQGVPLIQRRTK